MITNSFRNTKEHNEEYDECPVSTTWPKTITRPSHLKAFGRGRALSRDMEKEQPKLRPNTGF